MKDVIAIFYAVSAVLFPLGVYQLLEILCWLFRQVTVTFAI